MSFRFMVLRAQQSVTQGVYALCFKLRVPHCMAQLFAAFALIGKGEMVRYMAATHSLSFTASVSMHSEGLLFVDHLLGALWQFESFLRRVQDGLHLLQDGTFCICVFG